MGAKIVAIFVVSYRSPVFGSHTESDFPVESAGDNQSTVTIDTVLIVCSYGSIINAGDVDLNSMLGKCPFFIHHGQENVRMTMLVGVGCDLNEPLVPLSGDNNILRRDSNGVTGFDEDLKTVCWSFHVTDRKGIKSD